ncbi:DMT family transporter [Leucobacter sp. 1207-22]|uniref:DMT family transporter n=1 Tax=Leucobacter sp. 1207-22 TaxID=2604456 RepID=UPI0040649A8C
MNNAASGRRSARTPVWAALLLSGFAGMLVATQSRMNGQLSVEIGNGYVAAAISFTIGLVIVSAIVACSPKGRRGIGRVRKEITTGRLPVWALFGGLGGALFVLGQGTITPIVGVALYTIGIVAGQVIGGLVLDTTGLGPGGRMRTSPTRLTGATLVIIAVAITAFADIHDWIGLLWLVLPILFGAAVSMQSVANGLVRSAAQSALTATFGNFIVGASTLCVAALVSVLLNGLPESLPATPWLYFGGPIGVLFIAIAAALVRTAGVLMLSMSNVAGQLVAAVAFEVFLPLSAGVTVSLLCGAVIALLGVVVAALPSKRTAA